ncbi:RNA-binding transcriptional accessory protein [Polynucleobacter sp. MWH-CaK5]|uniref:Tex family protein n=1 Tax=Polynucleobacter sp. MWH-CaK5 TaxID=2689107 RepID=UPI001BFDE9C6|nr:Tex family protein [Polynucleobacter sp. MWH-CaK5]QWD89179.1 RNA-binding transcriptional accessory protein [Polynucleobacter sp. MWH-CaK5]
MDLNLPSAEQIALRINNQIAKEMKVRPQQIGVAVGLMDEGATVPFIARYRKEVTGGLDDTQLRNIEERLLYLRELEERRVAILKSIHEQGKLTDALMTSIGAADTKQTLEDLYLPYKPKRRTKAMIAREAGLEPLARALMADPTLDPQVEAIKYINIDPAAYAALSAEDIKKSQAGDESVHGGQPLVPDVKTALDGARDILAEEFSEMAPLLATLRDFLWSQGLMTSKVADGKEMAEEEKFRDYYAYSEPVRLVPSHRALALFRGRQLGVLQLKLSLEDSQEALVPHPCEVMIAKHVGIESLGRSADKWLAEVCRWTWRVKTSLSLEMALFTQLREAAETEAIKVFARNLHELLLAAPAGPKVVMGVDPGIRTGCKVAVVDATGKLLETSTIYPHEPRKDWDGSLAVLGALCVKHQVSLVAIGNGTASRETDRLVKDLMKLLSVKKGDQDTLQKIVVSEAGASVYSASELAALEFPELDVSLRGAVSIARRLQDPLAELVKIEPKAIGVGQYQHDVNQFQLSRTLDAVVEDCVNAVGVDLNTASVPLLSKVSGLNAGLARNIVAFRDSKGRFNNREALKEVPRLGDKAFEQAAGFLRISGGDNPLDQSSVHPESYPLVEKMLKQLGQPVTEVIGNKELLKKVAANDVIQKLVDDKFGVVTIKDILAELEKPGRDPRPEFKTATFEDGVEDINQLIPGMILEGVVTNVAAFGAFIDIGIHQDGLVHVSALADKFVKDPHEVVKAGQVVKVKVLEVDVKRRRIGLTMKLNDSAPSNAAARSQPGERVSNNGAKGSVKPSSQRQQGSSAPVGNTAFAEAFSKLKAKN